MGAAVGSEQSSRIRGLCSVLTWAVAVGFVMIACSSAKSDGPRVKICGTYIGASFVGGPQLTKIYDQPSNDIHVPLQQPVPAAAGWYQLTIDCDHGDAVTINDPTAIQLRDSVKSKDGRYVAILLTATKVGTTSITITPPNGQSRILNLDVTTD